MKHTVCSECKVILTCDWLGLSIDSDDECSERDERHNPIEKDCNCKTHCSETPEEAEHEIKHWFGASRTYDYKRFGVDE